MTQDPQPLTVGFAITSVHGPAWISDVVERVEGSGHAIVVGIVATGRVRSRRSATVGRALLRAYGRADDRIFGMSDDPRRQVELGNQAEANPRSGASTPATTSPDIVIRLDGRSEPLEAWPAPAYGTWEMRHGAGLPASVREQSLELPPGGAEMLLRQTITISQLVVSDKTGRRIVGEVVSRVDPLSMRRGAAGHVRKLPGMITHAISSVASERLVGRPLTEPTADDRDPIGSGEIVYRLVGIPVGYVGRLISRTLAPTRWVVAISREHDDPRVSDGRPFAFLEAPAGTEWTDPFPVRTPDADLVFVEEYDLTAHRGRLVVVELDDDRGGWRSANTILELPTHLSYPFVFEWSGRWYLLPEQASTGQLQLYVAESFPGLWQWHSTALDLPAADATVVEIDGRWWMFAAMSVAGGIATDDLHLFYADTPLGPWQAHPHNPVVSDVRTARPGGRVYQQDGIWYRVAQDGAVTYGHSIAIIRIDRIDLEGYAETVVDVIRPDWAPGLVGTHTINRDGALTAVDALRRKPRLRL